MKLIKLDNRGIGFLDVIVSIVITMGLVFVLANFSFFAEKTILENRIKSTFYEEANKAIETRCYGKSNWSENKDYLYKSKTIPSQYGDIKVDCKINLENHTNGVYSYVTDKLNISVSCNEKIETYEINTSRNHVDD